MKLKTKKRWIIKGLLLITLMTLMALNTIAEIQPTAISMTLARNDDLVRAGSYLEAVIVGKSNIEDLTQTKVSVFIPRLNLWQTETIQNFDKDDYISRKFSFDIPYNAEPDIYEIVYIINEGSYRRVQYRFFEIY